ncbi:hypothetical protein [Actinomadura litoris]|uniref:hypothetical protein n=1 Tax=Actinomadura litoris TaxID=2678616 RepID=UPI001FA78029|nr:hypothetical protein [Actinomadura litoris]
MLVRVFVSVAAACVIGIGTAGTASAEPAPVMRDLNVNLYNVHNGGEGSGNDSLLEVDRSLNVAKGNGSPGSDIINEVAGSSTGMSPGSSSGPFDGTFTHVTPEESQDE